MKKTISASPKSFLLTVTTEVIITDDSLIEPIKTKIEKLLSGRIEKYDNGKVHNAKLLSEVLDVKSEEELKNEMENENRLNEILQKEFDKTHESGAEFGMEWVNMNDLAKHIAQHCGLDCTDKRIKTFCSLLVFKLMKENQKLLTR